MKQRKPKLKRNSPGRPRLRYKGLAIVMRLPPDELKGSCPSEWCSNGEAVVISGRAGSIKLPLRAA